MIKKIETRAAIVKHGTVMGLGTPEPCGHPGPENKQ